MVEVLRRGVFGCLERVFSARATDDDGQVVGRAGRSPERTELLVEEAHERGRIEDRLRLLVEVALVRRAAALGHEEELVCRLVAGFGVGVELDLRGQVGAGVALVPHRHRGHLAVAQVEPGVGVVDAAAEGPLVGAAGEDLLAALAHDDRGPGVLAHRQDTTGGDVGVLEQVEGDELVVVARLRVLEDATQLGQVGRAQVVGDVVHGGLGEQPQRLVVDLQESPSGERALTLDDPDPVGRQQPPGGLVGPVAPRSRQQVLERELGHHHSHSSIRLTASPA